MVRTKIKKRRKIKRKKQFWKNKMFWLLVFIFLAVDGLFYAFIFSEVFQIKEIKINENNIVASQALEEIIESGITKKIVFPTKTMFLADLRTIEKEILHKFPKIKTAEIKRQFPNTLILSVEARQSFMVFCDNNNQCFNVDEHGIAFKENTEEIGSAIYLSDKNISLGEKIISKEYLKSIKEIQKNLVQDLKIGIKEFSLLENRLNVKTSNGYYIYFDLDKNVLDQIFNLNQILKEKISEQQTENLQYIDLRFGNRVFYK